MLKKFQESTTSMSQLQKIKFRNESTHPTAGINFNFLSKSLLL